MASFLNYLLHSTILLSLVLVLIKLPYFKQAKARDILLKTAILISFISPFLSHQSFSKPELATIELPILAVIENKGSAPLVESYDATTDTAKGFSNSKSAQMNWAFIPVILLCLGGLIASFRFVRAYGVIRGIISKSQLLIIKGTDGKIRILSTPFISSPVAFGLNTILVPEHMVSQFSSKQLEVVLAHEMAHLKRQDPFWNGLFSFLSHTCFFQPLNFLALRIWQHTTEELCDAEAVRKTHDPLTLAQSILQITQQANSRNLLTTGMVTQTHLRRRIEALLNPKEITMKRWQLLSISVIPVLMALVLPLISFAQTSKVVVLDAGHGGHDFGAVAGDIHEAAINLSVALKVKALLEQEGISVIMTRDSDKFVEIESRVKLTDPSANVFISLHTNMVDNSQVQGIETWIAGYSRELSDQNFTEINNLTQTLTPIEINLAKKFQENLVSTTGAKDRGTRENAFFVLRKSPIPAVLISLGFISNPEEAQKLITEEYQQTLAEAISKTLVQYLK